MKKFQLFNTNSQAGQSLITLLFFMAIGITVVTSAAVIISADMLSASNSEKGLDAYYNAESGVEDGILYVLRNHPTTNVSLTLSNATVTITYNSGVNTISSVGTDGTTIRTVLARATFNGGTFVVSGWKEQ